MIGRELSFGAGDGSAGRSGGFASKDSARHACDLRDVKQRKADPWNLVKS